MSDHDEVATMNCDAATSCDCIATTGQAEKPTC